LNRTAGLDCATPCFGHPPYPCASASTAVWWPLQLHPLQVGFKRELVKEVHAFVQDAQAFRRDWEANGPMVPGLDPMEAVDRLKKFQQMFEVSQ